MLSVAFNHGGLANIPAVIVQAPVRAKFLYADGIQMARYGFHETHLTLTICLLNGAVTASVLIVTGKYAILTVNNLCYQFSLGIGLGYTLILYCLKGIGR